MKKMALIFSVLACALVLSSCASKDQGTTAVDSAQVASAHHDYKGEVGKK